MTPPALAATTSEITTVGGADSIGMTQQYGSFKGYISKIESLIANQVGVVDFLGGLLGDLKDAVHRLRILTEESKRERERVCVTAFSSKCSDAHQRLNI